MHRRACIHRVVIMNYRPPTTPCHVPCPCTWAGYFPITPRRLITFSPPPLPPPTPVTPSTPYNMPQTPLYSCCPTGKEALPDSLDPHTDGSKPASRTNSFEIENLLKTAEQVTGICRSPGETRKSSPTGSVLSAHSQVMTPSRQLTDAEKLKKVILELVETERTYVKVRVRMCGREIL